MAGAWFWGYSSKHCNPSTPVTVIIHDTVSHVIRDTIPWYITKTDTVILRDTIPIIPDTTAILQKYFAFYTYERSWTDSLLSVTLSDVVTENKVVDSYFRYKILREQTIINEVKNEIVYSRYLYAGGTVSPKYAEFGLFYASGNTFAGLQYNPFFKTPSVLIGLRIVKFR